MAEPFREEKCKEEIRTARHFREEVPEIVRSLVQSCQNEESFDHIGPEPIPSRESIILILKRIFRLLYPGYFITERLDKVNLEYYLGQEATALFETLSQQIALSIRHDCIRHGLDCVMCEQRGQEETIKFLTQLPDLRAILATDIRAAHQGDPAAASYDEIIFSYPGLFAVTVYRVAHQLFHQQVPLMPRIMTEYAHSQTGIDIHPAPTSG